LLKKLAKKRKRLAESQLAIVVGGGSTGVETAAEIKARFPNKKVVLYHSKSRLLIGQRQVKEADSALILKKLQHLGVEVKLNSYFTEEDLKTSTNAYVVEAKGGLPNTGFVPPQWKNKEGFIRADGNLNVINLKNAFVVGDIVAGADPTVVTAKYLHVPVVVDNVVRVVNGNPKLKAMGKLPAAFANMLVLPIGPNDGVKLGVMGKMAGGLIVKDYGLARARKELMIKN
jgi:NADH dehydrogenase FAD-containing subunit